MWFCANKYNTTQSFSDLTLTVGGGEYFSGGLGFRWKSARNEKRRNYMLSVEVSKLKAIYAINQYKNYLQLFISLGLIRWSFGVNNSWSNDVVLGGIFARFFKFLQIKYTHTSRTTNRRTNRQTDRQTNKQTNKQTNRQTNENAKITLLPLHMPRCYS